MTSGRTSARSKPRDSNPGSAKYSACHYCAHRRVGGWRMFSKKKKKRLGNGSRLWSKAEERASHQEIKDAKQRLESEKGSGGANNIYKQSWR